MISLTKLITECILGTISSVAIVIQFTKKIIGQVNKIKII